MPSLDALAGDLADKLAALVARSLAAAEARLVAKLEAAAVKGAVIDRDGGLVLTFGDGSTRTLGRVVGQDGKDGVDGQDGTPGPAGLGFEDLDVSLDEDGRTLVLKFERGALAEVFELELPVLVYRGVYAVERVYRPGDCVTFGGSAWVCHCLTSTRPGEGDEWQLAVKRGRDGKSLAGPALKVAV
jgi:hypothetical protein